MSDTSYVRTSSGWQDFRYIYVKHSGSWRRVDTAWIKHNGSWERFYGIDELSVEYLVVGGGGGGGTNRSGWDPGGGGGGGGGYRTNVSGQTSGRNSTAEAALTLNTNTSIL